MGQVLQGSTLFTGMSPQGTISPRRETDRGKAVCLEMFAAGLFMPASNWRKFKRPNVGSAEQHADIQKDEILNGSAK